MATAFNLVDYRTVADPIRRPRLRIVEPRPVAEPRQAEAAESVQLPVVPAAPVAPVAAVVPEQAPSDDHKPAPPSWMIAPPFQGDPVLNAHQSWAACSPAAPAISVNEPQAAYMPTQDQGPYRNAREVPRAGW